MRLKHDRRVNIQIQLRQSIFVVVICYDVEVHEKKKGRVHTATTCLIGNLFAVLQFMQVINKQRNGIKHEYMINNCKKATYLLLPFFTKGC